MEAFPFLDYGVLLPTFLKDVDLEQTSDTGLFSSPAAVAGGPSSCRRAHCRCSLRSLLLILGVCFWKAHLNEWTIASLVSLKNLDSWIWPDFSSEKPYCLPWAGYIEWQAHDSFDKFHQPTWYLETCMIPAAIPHSQFSLYIYESSLPFFINIQDLYSGPCAFRNPSLTALSLHLS